MRIGVEEAELEDLLEQDPRSGHGDVCGCRAHRADALEVVDARRPSMNSMAITRGVEKASIVYGMCAVGSSAN